MIFSTDLEISTLPETFATFFHQKIVKIRENLLMSVSSVVDSSCSCELMVLDSLSLYEVISIVRKMPAKSCELDPMPTKSVKDCIDVLAPVLQRIVNASV